MLNKYENMIFSIIASKKAKLKSDVKQGALTTMFYVIPESFSVEKVIWDPGLS